MSLPVNNGITKSLTLYKERYFKSSKRLSESNFTFLKSKPYFSTHKKLIVQTVSSSHDKKYSLSVFNVLYTILFGFTRQSGTVVKHN